MGAVGDEHGVVVGRVSLAVSPNGRSAAFGFSGPRTDGRLHAEVTRHDFGTGWVVEHARKVTAVRGPLVMDPHGSSAGMVAILRAAGIPLELLSTAEVVKACGAFQDDVLNQRLTYPESNLELTAAVVGADVRAVGQGWVFAAKSSNVDIVPLEAAYLAAAVARQKPAPERHAPKRLR
jgi:hypothetical protein